MSEVPVRLPADAATVLVQEPRATVRLQLRAILATAGYHVLEADSAEQCLFIACEQRVQAFLLGARPRRMSLAQLCRCLRGLHGHTLTPIICMTTAADDALFSEALQAGADDCVRAPLSAAVLRARLATHLQRVAWHGELRRTRACLDRHVSPRAQRLLAAAADQATLPPPDTADLCVLATNLHGVVVPADGSSADALLGRLNRQLQGQADLVCRHGGSLERLGGDGLLAVFDGPGRYVAACRCALDILAASGRSTGHATALAVGMGIAAGPTLVGHLGTAERFAFSLVGQNLNEASGLSRQAPAGGVLISAAVAREIAGVPGMHVAAPFGKQNGAGRGATTARQLRPAPV